MAQRSDSLRTPVIDSIRVINGQSHLYWTPVADAQGYYIYHYDGRYVKIDSISGNQNTSYVDRIFHPCDSAQVYSLNAFKKNGDITTTSCCGASSSYLRGTVLLHLITFNNCTQTIHLDWDYPYPFPGSESFEIHQVDTAAKTDTLIGTTDGAALDYAFDFKRDSTYCFQIRAVSATGKTLSTSCEKCFTAHYPDKPDILDIATISVYQNKAIIVSCKIDSLKKETFVSISRKAEDESKFKFLGYIPIKGDTSIVSGGDSTALVNDKWYQYAVAVLDSCHAPYLYDTANSIHLQGKTINDSTNFLQWNPYQSTSDTVIAYVVLRQTSGYPDVRIQLPADSLSCYDKIIPYENFGYPFLYTVIAVVLPRFSPMDTLYCISNKVTIIQSLHLWIPNAFRPSSDVTVNTTFNPIKTGQKDDLVYHIQKDSYRLTIFNRWGQQLFSTTDMDKGWDGSSVPEGVYVYLITFKTLRGNTIQQRGTITLVR